MTEKDLDIIIGRYKLRFRSPIWWITSSLITLSTTAVFYIAMVILYSFS